MYKRQPLRRSPSLPPPPLTTSSEDEPAAALRRAAHNNRVRRLRGANQRGATNDNRRRLPIASPPAYPPGPRSPSLVPTLPDDQGPIHDDPMYPSDPLAYIDPPTTSWVDVPVDELPRLDGRPIINTGIESPRLSQATFRLLNGHLGFVHSSTAPSANSSLETLSLHVQPHTPPRLSLIHI